MLSAEERERIKTICKDITTRIENIHIRCFKGMHQPLFLISEQYPGVWLEHVYDSILYAEIDCKGIEIAKNTIRLFINNQKSDGQLPCYVWDAAKVDCEPEALIGYSQIQECVSFAQLCLEVCEMADDEVLLHEAYDSAKAWEGWLRRNRMTLGKGLVEAFMGFDLGHDNSGRYEGFAHPMNHRVNGERLNAACLPEEDGITPMLAVDMNANFYATEKALAEMAEKLGKVEEAAEWRRRAAEVKDLLLRFCYDEADGFFYDVDKNGNRRKYLSSSILHLFMERVLDKKEDAQLIERIYESHIKNPKEFWTNYPFPSMAISDPSWKKHSESNCWGYFSQGLIALRCIRWMDHYGKSEDLDIICEKWLKAWTACFDEMKLGQELDPITGQPSEASEWYSSCMLFYIYSARRLGIVNFILG